jgi:prolyl 4-hydroxylase
MKDAGQGKSFPFMHISTDTRKGKAILFYNLDRQGNPDPLSYDARAVVASREKWIATIWIREGRFK